MTPKSRLTDRVQSLEKIKNLRSSKSGKILAIILEMLKASPPLKYRHSSKCDTIVHYYALSPNTCGACNGSLLKTGPWPGNEILK